MRDMHLAFRQFVLDRLRTVLLALSLIIMAKTAWVLAPIVAPALG